MAFILTCFAVYVLVFGPADSEYIITTPRKWTRGAGSQICTSIEKGTFTPADSLRYKLEEFKSKNVLSDDSLTLPTGETHGCIDVPVPLSREELVTLSVVGSLDKEAVNEMVNLTFAEQGELTVISTDKYLYRPGQTVQFRILTVKGPNILVATDTYEEVTVTNPSNIRIAQWNNVENFAGLVHLSFDLYDEIEEGSYTIEVRLSDKSTHIKIFEVRDFVLPRFDVVLECVNTLLGSDETVTMTLCARYTFGEKVRGNATLYLATGTFPVHANLSQNAQIDGCHNFTFPAKDLLFDYNNCHISVNYLIANAVVIEEGTGVEIYGTNEYIPVHRRAITFRDESPSDVKKPYLPALINIATTFADGKPAVNESMNVCTFYETENICKNFTTNSEGILRFIVPSQLPSPFIEIKANKYPKIERNYNDVMEESSHYVFISDYREYVDSMNASLTIMRKMIKCTTGENVEFVIPVVYITREDTSVELNVQIAARGQVIASNRMSVQLTGSDLGIKEEDKLIPLETVPEGVTIGSLEIPMTLTERSSPSVSILVWYTRPDGTVVADAAEVQVSECLPHKVTFEWSQARVQPGAEASLIIKGESNSLCSIGVVDKSVDILSAGNNNYLDVNLLLGVVYNSNLDRFSGNDQTNLQYCLRKYGRPSNIGSPKTSSPSPADFGFDSFVNPFSIVQALHMFNEAGYLVMTNLDVARRYCEELIIFDLLQNCCNDQPDSPFSSPPFEGARSKTRGGASFADADGGASPEQLDQGLTVPEAPEAQERSYFPETWLWLLRPLSSIGELNEEMTLPDTITEWIGNAVCVHPTEGVGISPSASITTFTPFFVDLTLPSSAIRGEILPITISVFNYLENDLPVRVFVEASPDFQFVEGETGVRELCIGSAFKAVETIKVKLTRIGDVNITVEASSQPLSFGYCGSGSPPQRRDRLVRSLPVEPEGYLRERTFTEYICTQDVEDPRLPVSSWLLESPEAAVADSGRAFITANGDLIGPTIENLGYLIGLPYGCGEQNMINFAPNVYILQYLDASGQTTPGIREKIIGFLNEGYQRQLKFKHDDGSYSTFGERDEEGSTWLTAFVVKSFAQARPYTYIDENVLQLSTNWLEDLQQPDGCFEPKGRVINKLLQGGIAGSGGSKELLTAYVLAALLETGNFSDALRNSAVQCVETDTSVHPYSLALKGYSLALAKAPSAKAVIDQLLDLSVSNSSIIRWTLPDREGQDTSLHVETASYALLALLTFDYELYKEDARKIVRWLTDQRNGQGGFYSTQDTVVALQALTAFEKTQSQEPMDVDIMVTSTDLSHTFKITDQNRFLQQRVDVPTLPANVDINVAGVGCALFQGVLRYNVLSDSDSDVFSLKVDGENVISEGCEGKTRNITVCTTYNLQDGASNMAIIAFKLTTGYVANQDDLSSIVGNGTSVFKRFEVERQRVTLYLEEITSQEICISVRAFPEIEIESAKPGSVSVYDYYQPEYIATKILDFSSPVCPSSK